MLVQVQKKFACTEIFPYFCRFGHSQVTGNLLMVDKNKSTVKDVPYTEVGNLKFPSFIIHDGCFPRRF